ncbi:hypothetical protein EPO17_02705 [Patescibacteria group bacterium]|nr:MAG: hypothetical protein EPO17_02705 [Patescibacteria group bacterium]
MEQFDDTVDVPRRSFLGFRKHPTVPHYHGHIVRRLFVLAGIIMLIGLPFFASLVKGGVLMAIAGILVIGLYAGLTTPKHTWIMWGDVVLSVIGSLIFEVIAIGLYTTESSIGMYFVFNQVLAIVFFFALYFSVKTFRAMVLRQTK